MGIKEVLVSTKRTLSAVLSRIRNGGRASRAPRTEEGHPDLFADREISRTEGLPEGGFPGFSPEPGFKEKIRGTLDASVGRIRENPRIIAAAAGGLLVLSLAIIGLAFAFRPPKPVDAPRPGDAAALDILRRIPVPRIDPLSEDSWLDRPGKGRYTEAEIAERWLDLGLLPTEELREKNEAELRSILSIREKP